MHSHPHTDQSNVGAGRSILFISTRFSSPTSSSVGIAICGPDKNADAVSGQPPFGDRHTPPNNNKPSENPAG
jgi:hypothetical protein